MEYKNWSRIKELAVKQKNRHAVYISNGLDLGEHTDVEIWDFVEREIKSKFKEQEVDILSNLLVGGLFFFDNEEEALRFYEIFEQELTDSSAIYAVLYDKSGECLTENT